MKNRTNEATWSETKQQWRIAVRWDGQGKSFYSYIPGRCGKPEAEQS